MADNMNASGWDLLRDREPVKILGNVRFFTDLVNSGEGTVIDLDPEKEIVTVLDQDGQQWRGPLEMVEPVEGCDL